ncbi:GTPase family protein [Brachybacterium sp. DNPG3]
MSPRDGGARRGRGRGRRRGEAAVPLAERIAALERAVGALDGVAPDGEVAAVRETLGRIDRRRALSAEHTVVGVFGATGSGKSSLVNALVGREISRAAVRRPTTGAPVAAVLGEAGSEALLDWLGVEDRHLLDGSGAVLETAARETAARGAADEGAGLPGLVLLDLPDFDSVEADNRAIVERMTGMVDVIVWVTDPQKYADAVLHREFAAPFAGHDAVTLVVLNQLDRLRADEREGVLASLERIIRADGLASAPVLGVSARTGEGLDDLRDRIAGIARGREAVAARQRADVAGAATRLLAAADPAGLPGRIPAAAVDALVEDLSVAARIDPVATAVGASYRYRAQGRVGWPPVRWLRRLRPDPLRRLGIGTGRDRAELERTSLPAPDAAARARASGGVRRLADAASAGGTDPWRADLRRAARAREDELPDALDRAVAEADLRAGERAPWWPLLDVLQWIALLTAVVGLGWLALNAGLAFLGMPSLPLPMLEGLGVPVPLPTALIVLGIAVGILLATAGTAIAVAVGAGHRRRARRVLRGRVREVAQALVVAEVDERLEAASAAASDLAHAGGVRPSSPV